MTTSRPLPSARAPFSIVHTTASLHARHGGPPRTVTALVEELGRAGEAVHIVAGAEGASEDRLRPDPTVAKTTFVEAGAGTLGRFREAVGTVSPDLIHDHGLWLPTNHAAAQVAERHRVPFVVSTRGMLEPWARRHHLVRKTVAWWAYQRWDLQRAAMLHATAESEAEHLRALGLRPPIAIIPNGVTVPPETPRGVRAPGSPRRALFLSRVHPKKGLSLLLEGWAEVRPAGWELVIAGPDEDGHRAELAAQARQRGLDSEVQFHDAVADDAKWALYHSADLFVLPTHSENFGVVVAEALAAGIPALTTKGAPWKGLQDHACGWWTEIGVRPIAEALRDATSRSDAEREAMGARGRAWVARAYGWPQIARQMQEAYAWVLGVRQEAPACIDV